MIPVKTITEIRLKEPAGKFSFMGDIISLLGGSLPQGKKLALGGGIRVRLKERKVIAVVESQRFALLIEEPMQIDEIKSYTMNLVLKIYHHLGWGELQRIGVRTLWIKEVPDFKKLLEKSKQKFFSASSELVSESSDVALPLTFVDGENKINFNYGPMKSEQFISQFSEFKDSVKLPSSFGLVDVDYFSDAQGRLSKNYLKEFWNRAISWAEANTARVYKELDI